MLQHAIMQIEMVVSQGQRRNNYCDKYYRLVLNTTKILKSFDLNYDIQIEGNRFRYFVSVFQSSKVLEKLPAVFKSECVERGLQ